MEQQASIGDIADESEFEEKTESLENSPNINKIPINNLWFLMYYAIKELGKIKDTKNQSEKLDIPDYLPILAARILVHSVELRLKRNLHFNYQPRQEILKRVRGRIDLLKTERRQLLEKAQIACRFEEFTIDTPRNRFVRDALDKAVGLILRHNKTKLKTESKTIISKNIAIANKCRSLALILRRAGVIGKAPTYKDMQAERFGRHDINDRQMVSAALLIFDLTLPTERKGKSHLLSPFIEEKWLWKLFENGIAGFYKTVLSQEWKVTDQKSFGFLKDNWSDRIDEILPRMKPDIIIKKKNKTIIIDTKFTSAVKNNGYGKCKLNSSHIYQISAYIKSEKEMSNDSDEIKFEGILLYPSIGDDENGDIKDEYIETKNDKIKIRFATVNLASSENEIRERLIEIIEPS